MTTLCSGSMRFLLDAIDGEIDISYIYIYIFFFLLHNATIKRALRTWSIGQPRVIAYNNVKPSWYTRIIYYYYYYIFTRVAGGGRRY